MLLLREESSPSPDYGELKAIQSLPIDMFNKHILGIIDDEALKSSSCESFNDEVTNFDEKSFILFHCNGIRSPSEKERSQD